LLKLVYEGKSKKLYDLGGGELLLEFKDEVTAFDGKYKDSAAEKGVLSARLSSRLFEVLEKGGVKTHYICYKGDRFIKVKACKAVPLEVIVRSYAYGSLLKRMPLIERLKKLSKPMVEFHFKADELHDPLLLEQDIVESGLLNQGGVARLKETALRVNDILSSFWEERKLRLVDMKIEFGVGPAGNELLVIDDISGDSMRVLTSEGRHLDKETYRMKRDLNLLVEGYRKMAEAAGPPSVVCS